MKKFLAVILALTMVLGLCACGSSGGGEKEAKEKDTGLIKIGDAQAEYIGYEIAKNSDGKDAIVLSYNYTNNSDHAQMFSFAIFYTIYQGDTELEYCTVYPDDSETGALDNSLIIPVDPGKTQKVQITYTLKDLTTPVRIEFTDLLESNTAEQTI